MCCGSYHTACCAVDIMKTSPWWAQTATILDFLLRKCKQIKGNESHRNLGHSYFGTTSKGLGSGNVTMFPPCGKVVASGFSDHLADGGWDAGSSSGSGCFGCAFSTHLLTNQRTVECRPRNEKTLQKDPTCWASCFSIFRGFGMHIWVRKVGKLCSAVCWSL